MSQHNANGFRALMAAVIDRAIGDLKGAGPPCRKIEMDRTMAFILSDTCEAYCLELGMDCQTVKEKAAALYRQFLEKEEPERPPRTAQVIPAFRLCRACSLSA